MNEFIQRHTDNIAFVFSGYDRVVITGTLVDIGHGRAATSYAYDNEMRIFDFPEFAKTIRADIRERTKKLGEQHGVAVEFIRRKTFRKEDRIKEIIEQRGAHPGLVHIFSAMETCNTLEPWHDKQSHKTYLRTTPGKCIHYYFYFIDPVLGLCYLRLPTWAPYRLQFYFNAHNFVARRLDKKGIAYTLRDNAFLSIDDPQAAQEISDAFSPKGLKNRLNKFAKRFCPFLDEFPGGYHWSLMQVEYATDIVFKRQDDFQPLYEHLTRTAIHAVKADDIATFLGRKMDPRYKDEVGNDFSTRIEGTRIKHRMGKSSIKMYDKFGMILRVETTTNDVSFFKHYRKVNHRDGTRSRTYAPFRKTIFSMSDLREVMHDSNRRYLAYLSTLDDPTPGVKSLEKISRPNRRDGRNSRGFNLFSGDDLDVFQSIVRGEYNISGFRNTNLRAELGDKNSGQISRILKRLRTHGLIKKIGRTYKYYLTALGRRVVATAMRIRETIILPSLNGLMQPCV